MPHEDHEEVHTLAARESDEHPEALADSAGDESVDEKIAKLDKRLTGRINDLRKDFDATKKAISNSVKTLSDNVDSLKTATENNKASIEAQDASIANADKKAERAQHSAEAAAQAVTEVREALDSLTAAFRSHTHPVQLTVNGTTNPPQPYAEGSA